LDDEALPLRAGPAAGRKSTGINNYAPFQTSHRITTMHSPVLPLVFLPYVIPKLVSLMVIPHVSAANSNLSVTA
jgi:hypothetical protein